MLRRQDRHEVYSIQRISMSVSDVCVGISYYYIVTYYSLHLLHTAILIIHCCWSDKRSNLKSHFDLWEIVMRLFQFF